ncbi:hypothetical protein [Corynebacterium halotolerans]|uniref:hypothetical protein n=1 Tax=Corynebacterium halotolerans TaxID=225326 RepID=UPI003CE7565B
MPAHRPDPPSPMDGQNFPHSSGSPTARIPDPTPQEADQSRESLNTRIITAAVAIVILVAILAVIVF